MPADTKGRVTRLIVDHLGIDEAKVTDNAHLADDLGADSLDAIELIMACEDEFHIEISDEQLDRVRTVADIVRLIDKLWLEQHP